MVVALAVDPEADRNVIVVDAEQLVGHRAGGVAGREVGLAEVAVHVDPAEVGVHADTHVGVGEEADRDAAVVQAGHLGLHRAGEVLVGVVSLAVRRLQQVALVRVARRAGAEVSRDQASVVDPEQLVERHVVLVIKGLDTVAGGLASAHGAGAGRSGQAHRSGGHNPGRNGGGGDPPHSLLHGQSPC